jgi:hypothetical protein
MDKTTNYLTERLVIAVSPEQKREIHDQAAAAGKGIGEYLREILFPDTTQAELETLQHRMKLLERRIQTLESLIGKGASS